MKHVFAGLLIAESIVFTTAVAGDLSISSGEITVKYAMLVKTYTTVTIDTPM